MVMKVGVYYNVMILELHGGLLSLNAWKLSPTPRKIEMVTYTHSNEPDNRCPLEPAVHEVHKT